jgi:putative tricarboxylic transport membrane protein
LATKLLFSGGLAAFFAYCFVYISMTAPANKVGELSGSQYPQIIIILLEVFLIINIIKIIKGTPKADKNLKSITSVDYKGFYKSKLILGIAILLAYAFAMDYLGFLIGTFLFVMAYAWLLGEKRIKNLLLYSVLISVILYILFSFGLDVMLPRGVGPLRDFALMLESI